MQEPAVPQNEAARVATLRSLNILDTPREARFDRYTETSARTFDTPIAVISLVDRYRQWFKSSAGLLENETPRNVSFCGHAILGDDVFEVPNARRDPRFRDNPLVVREPHIQFYAGAPLVTPDGFKLGTLCIIDRVPRKLSVEEKSMLKNLADMVVAEMVENMDVETGLANRNGLIDAGIKCLTTTDSSKDFSLHLFDISGVNNAATKPELELPSTEIFTKLLSSFYPGALSIANLGGEAFCVLVRPDAGFDERRAISHLCTVTKNALCQRGRADRFLPFVGLIQYDSKKHATFDDVMKEVDAIYVKRRQQDDSKAEMKTRFRDVMTILQKTFR
ncbi:MAG: GAF domain-containing protein [Woeseia sp.]